MKVGKYTLDLVKLGKVLAYAETALDAATVLNHSHEYKHKEKVTKALNVSKSVLGVGKVLSNVLKK